MPGHQSPTLGSRIELRGGGTCGENKQAETGEQPGTQPERTLPSFVVREHRAPPFTIEDDGKRRMV